MANRKGIKPVPWTEEEDNILIENVKENVTNLTTAFKLTSQKTKRGQKAVAAHWYSRVSKEGDHCLFLTVSGKHIAVNRKNGKGKPSSLNFFQRVLAIFGLKY